MPGAAVSPYRAINARYVSLPQFHTYGAHGRLFVFIGSLALTCSRSPSLSFCIRRQGKGDRWEWEGMQMSVMPDVGRQMIGFNSEMLFEYPNEIGGGTYLDWAHGVVVTDVILTKTTKKFKVEWAVEKIFTSKWNPKKPEAGAWREFEPMRE